jgi:oxygen-independent coproporphyrinogen-3 oxidase
MPNLPKKHQAARSMQPIERKPHPKSLYVHIPYCDHICHYCDFTKMLTNPKQTRIYVDTLLKEIADYGSYQYETIFFGGGTPTALSDEDLKVLCDGVKFYASSQCEWTVECNVESTTLSKLEILKEAGVNRLSFGVQTFKKDALVSLNRHHDHQDIITAIQQAKDLGFRYINVDLIYDLPRVSDQDLQDDLKSFLSLNVNHIATYALTIHPNTVFGIQKIKPVTDEVSRHHYEMIYQTLIANDYERYEVSNFARNQEKSKHNLTYWRNQEYIGTGLGASGYLDGIRYTNTKNMTKYLQGIKRDQEEIIDEKMKRFEYIMLNFRLKDGFELSEFFKLFNIEFSKLFQNTLQPLIDKGLIIIENGYAKLSFEGMLLLDYTVLKLTKDLL